MARPETFVILFVILGCWSNLFSARLSDSQELFSPANSMIFHKTAYESYNSADAGDEDLRQAMEFLVAAKTLDPKAKYISADILTLAAKTADRRYAQTAFSAFEEYASENVDLEIANKAIGYLMDSLDSRNMREGVLHTVHRSIEGKNDILLSELEIYQALLMTERADFATARYFFNKVNNTNPYNKLAFAKLAELSLQAEEPIPPENYAVHLRLAMGAAPLDIKSAVEFASYLEKQGIYTLAADSYEYCVELYGYLWPQKPLPVSLYLPWAVANNNTLRGPEETIKIAEQVRRSGSFDIVLEAIAASAAAKTGDLKKKESILSAAGQKAVKILSVNPESTQVSDEQLAWFYCFADPQPEKALTWANMAYSRQSESVQVKSILAYALVMNGQNELAGELIPDTYYNNQIFSVAQSLIYSASKKRDAAIEIARQAIELDPTSLAAEKAKRILLENGSEYIPVSADAVLRALRANFGKNIVPYFTNPAKMVTVKLNLSGSDFSYGKDFGAYLVLTNTSSEPLVIFENGLFAGNIRVDAEISGDLIASIPALIVKRIRPDTPVLPGQYVSIPLQLVTGKLREILLTYPQAALEIEFTVYLDPVTGSNGEVANALVDIAPVKAVAKRPATVLNGKYLRQCLDNISGGRQGQKVRTSRLFVGLLAEQYVMDRKPLYRYTPVEQTILKDAIRKSISDSNWTVKLQTMAFMLILPTPMDYELTNTVSYNLYDDNWPVRMMALYLLSKSRGKGFKKVLDGTAKYDPDSFVSNFAVALGGQAPPKQPKEPPQTAPKAEK